MRIIKYIIFAIALSLIAQPAWPTTVVYSLKYLYDNNDVDSSISTAIANDAFIYNGTSWTNIPQTYGEIYFHTDNGTLDFATNVALVNVTGITNGIAKNVTPNGTNGTLTVIDSYVYRIAAGASFYSASAGTFDLHIGVNGAEVDNCHANRRIDTAASIGNIGITCMLNLTAGDAVTFMVNSEASETIKFEALNLNLNRSL